MALKTMAVVAFDGVSSFHLAVPGIVFSGLQKPGEPKLFSLQVCAVRKGPLRCSDNLCILVEEDLSVLMTANIIVVPSWHDAGIEPPQSLLAALRQAHQRGAQIIGLCLGAYVLAAAGLLDNRPATTHWGWTSDLARRYPAIRVRPDVLYVDDGDIVTSAGVAAGIDCCLHIVRRYHGADVAGRVARRMVVPPHRQGGQAQFIDPGMINEELPDRLVQLLEWVQQHLDQHHSIDSLAKRGMMSRRTLSRRVRAATGTSVGGWLLHQRLMLAQRLLETQTIPVSLVAQRAGFASEASLRTHFRKVFRTSPSRYRKEFHQG